MHHSAGIIGEASYRGGIIGEASLWKAKAYNGNLEYTTASSNLPWWAKEDDGKLKYFLSWPNKAYLHTWSKKPYLHAEVATLLCEHWCPHPVLLATETSSHGAKAGEGAKEARSKSAVRRDIWHHLGSFIGQNVIGVPKSFFALWSFTRRASEMFGCVWDAGRRWRSINMLRRYNCSHRWNVRPTTVGCIRHWFWWHSRRSTYAAQVRARRDQNFLKVSWGSKSQGKEVFYEHC